jgi:hypothetical protein
MVNKSVNPCFDYISHGNKSLNGKKYDNDLEIINNELLLHSFY